jgi:hypothetical protein
MLYQCSYHFITPLSSFLSFLESRELAQCSGSICLPREALFQDLLYRPLVWKVSGTKELGHQIHLKPGEGTQNLRKAEKRAGAPDSQES